MAWNLVAHQKIDGTTVPVTGASIDTTGATLLVVIGSNNGGPLVVTDNKGNTWRTNCTAESGTARYYTQIVYAWAPIVGAGHQLTVTGGSGGNGSVVVLAFSGARTSSDPLLANNHGHTAVSDTGITVPSITPSLDGALIVTGMGIDDPAGNTMGCSGFTITDTFDVVVGATFGISGAYQVQAVAAAIGPVWTRSTTNTQLGDNGVVAAFAPALASAVTVPATRMAPGQRGPFDRLGMLLSPYQRYSYVPVAAVAATTLQRKTLSPLGTHTGGRQSQ